MINDKSKIQGVWNHRATLSIFISVKDMYLISITKFQIDCHQYLRIGARLIEDAQIGSEEGQKDVARLIDTPILRYWW